MTTDLIAVEANGHAKGRAVPPLPQFTFQDSGITVGLRRLPPMAQQRLAEAIQREHPKPEPPTVQTELGPETNEADPEYHRRLDAWQMACATEMNRRLFKLACLQVECEVDADVVAQARRHLAAIGIPWEDDTNLTQEENDRVCYIQHVACTTPEDMHAFYRALMQRSQPTEAAVQKHIETFPGDVSE